MCLRFREGQTDLKNFQKVGRFEEKMAGFRLEWLGAVVGLGLGEKVKPCFSMD